MSQRCKNCMWLDMFSYYGLKDGERLCSIRLKIISLQEQHRFNDCSSFVGERDKNENNK